MGQYPLMPKCCASNRNKQTNKQAKKIEQESSKLKKLLELEPLLGFL